ncbi:hypothetical protein USDA257_c54860 [Sinorhizobium fredii USDA 257]|uniref:Uncharacterized protein n=1 Tax=Sinorhizobium fredii (strain USDA 257) TaxID=1185652 RepID=I3XDP5_SINF2|nr:hypothetical protein USDA257_c54860 [Sinorhizobium fredii USDA 257]
MEKILQAERGQINGKVAQSRARYAQAVMKEYAKKSMH